MKANQAGKLPIIVGSRVRVVQGRQFQNFGAGDLGLVVHVDKDAGTCDVAFDGREGRMTVASRYLEVDPAAAKPSVHPQGLTPPSSQLMEDHLSGSRPRATSNDSSTTDPNGHVIEDVRPPPAFLQASPDRPFSPPRREQPQPQFRPRPARGVAEVLHDVRRVREAQRQAAPSPGAAELCRGEPVVGLSEVVQASASATAAATANAMTEVGCLRQAFSELRELILLEAEQRVAGLREVQDGLEQVRAGHSPHSTGSESLLRAEQRRLEQQQAELVSLCASLKNLKEQHSESLLSPHGQASFQGGAVAATPPSDWELSVQLPLTARLNSLDARLVLVDERLSLLSGQVVALAEGRSAASPRGLSQALPAAGWEQPLAALGARVEALLQGEAQRNACLGQLQATLASEVEQAQQLLKAETGRLSAQLRSAATDVLGQVGGDGAGLLKAQADAERDRSAKLLESMQARLDTLSEGLASEARKREVAVAQVEAQVRRANGEADSKPPFLRATTSGTSIASGENGSLSKVAAVAPPIPEKPRESRVLSVDRPAEPRAAAQTEKFSGSGQALASLATRLPSADRVPRSRLRAELGSNSSGAGSPRLEKPPTAASLAVAGAVQPRTPRAGRAPGSEPDAGEPAAAVTPGSTVATTAAGGPTGEEATAPPTGTTTRILRMEASPVRQKSAPQGPVSSQRSTVLRGGLVGVDLSSATRPDLLISGLDLNQTEPMQNAAAVGLASPPPQQVQAMHGALTPGPPMASPGTVKPPGNLMSPSVPMMPMHMGGMPGHGHIAGQPPGIPGAPGGGLLWPSHLPQSPPSFGPLAPSAAAFLQPRM